MKSIIVTGCNKGIGFGIISHLVKKPNLKVIMACRSLDRGEKSRQELIKLNPDAKDKLDLLQLDIEDQNNIKQFSKQIAEKYNGVDILLNNAGIAFKGNDTVEDKARQTFKINLFNTVYLTEKLLPLIKQNGKIINAGSSTGKLSLFKNEELKKQIQRKELNKEQLFNLSEQYFTALRNNKRDVEGWPQRSYAFSKLCLYYYTKILAQQEIVIKNQIQTYIYCPGWVRTDLTSPEATLDIFQGAETPVYLVDLPHVLKPEIQGNFFFKKKVREDVVLKFPSK